MLSLKLILLLVSLSVLKSNSKEINVKNVNIKWFNNGETTDFYVTSSLASGISPSNAWLGIGLNSADEMDGTSVVVCKNLANGGPSVSHYFNFGFVPILLDSTDRNIGLSNKNVSVDGSNIICRFTRVNTIANSRYFDMNANTAGYLLVAYGSGDISYHFGNKDDVFANFTKEEIIPTVPSSNLTTAFNNETMIITTPQILTTKPPLIDNLIQKLKESWTQFVSWFQNLFGKH